MFQRAPPRAKRGMGAEEAVGAAAAETKAVRTAGASGRRGRRRKTRRRRRRSRCRRSACGLLLLACTILLVFCVWWWSLASTWYYHLHMLASHVSWWRDGGVRRAAHCQSAALVPDGASAVLDTAAPRIAIVSLFTGGFSWAGRLGEWNKRIWADKHGYEFIESAANQKYINTSRPVAWSKLKVIAAHLGDYDYVMYLDADMVITNPELNLQHLIHSARGADVMASADDFGLNSGALIFRNTPWAHAFLRRLWDQEHLVWDPNAPFRYEQRAFWYLMRKDPTIRQLHIALFPTCAMNSQLHYYPFSDSQWVPGDILVHFAGFDDKTRGVFFCIFVSRTHAWAQYPAHLLSDVPAAARPLCPTTTDRQARLRAGFRDTT